MRSTVAGDDADQDGPVALIDRQARGGQAMTMALSRQGPDRWR
jgi:hypothetical protein